MKRIVAVEIDFGGQPYDPIKVLFVREGENSDLNEGRRFVAGSYATYYRIEQVTAGWPAYIEMDSRYVKMKRQ